MNHYYMENIFLFFDSKFLINLGNSELRLMPEITIFLLKIDIVSSNDLKTRKKLIIQKIFHHRN